MPKISFGNFQLIEITKNKACKEEHLKISYKIKDN